VYEMKRLGRQFRDHDQSQRYILYRNYSHPLPDNVSYTATCAIEGSGRERS